MNKQRSDRLAQVRHRNSKRSYVTEIENLKICLAWACGELSEGQASKALGLDRVSARGHLAQLVEDGRALVETDR
jgi:predicted ArsR family transcriptional regulator